MNVLFVAALFVAACGATWRETKYYPYNYYYDYSTSPYTEVEHCSDQYDEIYVTLELLDSDETCTSEECDTGGHYNEIISCLDTVPDFSTYFTNYHLITLWDDLDDQCEGDVTNYFVYNKDACEYCYDTSGYEAWYVYYWTCDVFSHAMVEWQQSVSGSGEACGTSTYDYTWEPTEYYDYRMGDCIGDSYEGWYKVQCDADAASSNSQWQVIKYYFNDDTTCTNDPMYYEYYLTDTCITQACKEDPYTYYDYPNQVWSCQDTEPTPLGLVPVGTTWNLVLFYSFEDYTCAGDVKSTLVIPDICVSDGSYFYSWITDFETGEVSLHYYSTNTVCTDDYGYDTYVRGMPLDGYDGLVDLCWYDDTAYGWYVILEGTETATAGTQTIYYYPTNTSNPVVLIDQYDTDHCYTKTVASADWDELYEVWTCDILDPPDLMDLMPEGLFAYYYEVSDTTCTQEPRWTSAMTQVCVNDTVRENSFYFACTTGTTATSVTLEYYYCYDMGCTGCYSTYSDYGMYSSTGADAAYCYLKSYDDVEVPFVAHCAPPNPAYQTIEYFAAADASDDSQMTYAQSYWTEFCAELTQTGEHFFESWTCSATAGDPTTYFGGSPFYAVKYTDSACTTGNEAKYWEAFNPLCVGDSRTGVTASYVWSCDNTDDDYSEIELYYSSTSSDCFGDTYEDSYDGEIYSSYSYTDYCYDDWYGYSTYYKLYCGTGSGYQVIKYYADDAATDDSKLFEVQVGYLEQCSARGVLGWHYYDTHFTEDWSCSVTEPTPYDDWDDAFVVYYYDDSTTCEAASLQTFSSYPRDCVDHGALTESYLVYCDTTDSSVALKYELNDVVGCADDTPYTYTIISSSSESTAEDCWYTNYYDSFDLACRPPNPAYQIILASSSPTFDDSKVFMYSIEWSETCYLDEYYSDDLDASIKYICNVTLSAATPYDRWDNAIVATWYTDSACSTSSVSTDVYLPVDMCVASSVTGITGLGYICSFNGYNDASLEMAQYSTTPCTGTPTYKQTVLDNWGSASSPYCFEPYSSTYGSGYYFLECVPANPQFQVWTLWSDDTETDVLQAVYSNVSYCYEYPGSIYDTLSATWQTWRCFDDEPVWSTDVGFTSAPMEVTLFTSTDCSGESVMKMAATVECVTAGDYAYWGYCYPREGNIMGYGCYTASGYFGDCVDKDSKPWSYTGSICSGVAFVDAYDETAGDTCFDLGSTSMDDFLVTGETYTFTMTCGDMTTNSVWWTESYLDSESGCTEVSPIEAEGYYTRFCGATEEGTCVEQTQDTILKTWFNETCIGQDELEAYAKGGVYEITFADSECAPEYTTGVGIFMTGCWWDDLVFDYGWQVDCDHDSGEIYISSDCDDGCGVCATTEVLYTDKLCNAGTGESGYAFYCAGSSVIVGATLMVAALLAALF